MSLVDAMQTSLPSLSPRFRRCRSARSVARWRIIPSAAVPAAQPTEAAGLFIEHRDGVRHYRLGTESARKCPSPRRRRTYHSAPTTGPGGSGRRSPGGVSPGARLGFAAGVVPSAGCSSGAGALSDGNAAESRTPETEVQRPRFPHRRVRRSSRLSGTVTGFYVLLCGVVRGEIPRQGFFVFCHVMNHRTAFHIHSLSDQSSRAGSPQLPRHG